MSTSTGITTVEIGRYPVEALEITKDLLGDFVDHFDDVEDIQEDLESVFLAALRKYEPMCYLAGGSIRLDLSDGAVPEGTLNPGVVALCIAGLDVNACLERHDRTARPTRRATDGCSANAHITEWILPADIHISERKDLPLL